MCYITQSISEISISNSINVEKFLSQFIEKINDSFKIQRKKIQTKNKHNNHELEEKETSSPKTQKKQQSSNGNKSIKLIGNLIFIMIMRIKDQKFMQLKTMVKP